MLDIENPRFERIDGTDFQVGTADHRYAAAARDARHDAQYLERNHNLVEFWQRRLRDWEELRCRNDANSVAFLGRELVLVRSKIERVLYEKLRIAEFVPVEGGHPRGAQVYENQIWDEAGEARIMRQLSGDAPRVDVSRVGEQRPYVWADAAYGWTEEELYAAAYANIPLIGEKAMACARAIARKLDLIGRSGSIINNIRGFLNSSEVTVHTLTNGEHTSSATAAEMLADLNEIETTLLAVGGDNTPENYVLLVPTAVEGRYVTTPAGGSTVTDLSVKSYFLKNSRLIRDIRRYSVLDSAVTPDIAASDAPMSIAYPIPAGGGLKADPEFVIWPFSVQYEEEVPRPTGHEQVVRAKSRCSGVDFRHPKFFLYVQNND